MALDEATNPMRGVAGPGTFSKRTDLSYQSQNYGDGVAYQAAKSGAPLATAPKNPMLSQAPQVSAGGAQPPLAGLYDKSAYPERDIMHGNKLGPGAGPEILPGAQSAEKLSDTLAKMLPFDTDGSIAILYQNALARGN